MFIHQSGNANQPALIFLHGNGANSAMWKYHMERFTGYHCLAPDFPGFGCSSSEEWVSLQDTTRRIIDLIRKHPTGRAHVVGLSLGACVAITLLGQAPELIDHAIVDGAGVLPIPGAPMMKAGFHIMQPFIKLDPVIRLISNSLKMPADEYDEFRRNMRAMSASSFTHSFCQALDLRQPNGLDKVMCPVLFVAGEKEAQATHQSNVLLAQIMPRAQRRIAPGMGHGWLAQAPDLHYRMVRAWLNDQPLPQELNE